MKSFLYFTPISLLFCSSLGGCLSSANAELSHRSTPFSVQTVQDTHVVLPAPIPAGFERDPSLLPPSCEAIDSAIAPLRTRIEDCQETPDTHRCRRLRRILDEFGTSLDSVGEHSLTQTWSIQTQDPLITPSADSRALLRSMNLDPAQALYPASVTASAIPESLSIQGQDGSDWAPILALMNYSVKELSFHLDRRAFSTHDHVLACALLSGEASIQWTQRIKVDGQAPKTLLNARELTRAYDILQAADHALALGTVYTSALIGAAVGEIKGIDSEFKAYVEEVARLLFHPNTRLLLDLSPEAIEELATPPAPDLEVNSTWRLDRSFTGP